MTLTELQAQLTLVENKISEILQTGQSYSITGSFSVTNTDLAELRKQEKAIRRRILRWNGYTGRISPDFSEMGGNDELLPS